MGSVIRNKNTSQVGMTAAGLTGAQTEMFIPASRLYIKAIDATPSAPALKSGGKTPTSWTDMGIMMANSKVTYQKALEKVKVGIDKRLVGVYDNETTGTFEMNLTQYDDVVMEQVTGLSPYIVQSGSIVRFNIGAEAVVQKAILLVSQNKMDGLEVQYYNPNAFMSFSIEDQDNAQVVKVTCDLPLFNMDGVDQLFSQTFFHAGLASGY